MRVGRGGALAVAVLLAVLTGCGGGVTGEPQASTPSEMPSASLGAIPAGTGPIEPGTYRIPRSAWSVVDFTVAFPEGWTVKDGHYYLKGEDEGPIFAAVGLDTVYTDACEGGHDVLEVGPGVDDLAAALLKQRGPKASDPVDTTLGSYPAIRIDLTIPEGFDLKACNLEGNGLQIWFDHPTDDYFVLVPDGTASAYIVDVDGQRQVFLTQYLSATSDEDLRELQDVLDSMHIET